MSIHPQAESPAASRTEPTPRTAAALEFRRHGRALAAAMIGLCVGLPGLSNYGFGVFITPLTRDFGWSIADVSSWVFFLMLGSCGSSIWLGSLVDRLGARRVILMAIPLFAMSLSAAALMTGQLWQLRAVAFVAGAIGPGVSLLAYSQAINERFHAARGTALGLMTGGIGISSVIAPPLIQHCVDGLGWRTGFCVLGVAALAAFPFVYRWLTDSRQPLSRPVGRSPAGLGVRTAMQIPAFWLIAAIAFTVGAYSAGVIFNLLPLLTELGLSRPKAAAYLGLFGLFMFIGKITCGLTLDRFAVSRVGATILLAQAAALVWLARSPDNAIPVVISIIGFSTGGQIACSTYTIPRYLGMKTYGQVYGIVSIVGSVAVGVGPYLFSTLRELTRSYLVSLCVAAGMALIAGLLYAGLSPNRGPVVFSGAPVKSPPS
jgi:predicted MFS family arabinose efflux permease